MLRGVRVLNEDPVKKVSECLKVKSKGRNGDLLKKRNSVILYRYYLYKTFAKWSYETIIETVSDEMYLAPRTVTTILTTQIEDLRKINAEQPPLVRLSRKFPQYNWSISAVSSK